MTSSQQRSSWQSVCGLTTRGDAAHPFIRKPRWVCASPNDGLRRGTNVESLSPSHEHSTLLAEGCDRSDDLDMRPLVLFAERGAKLCERVRTSADVERNAVAGSGIVGDDVATGARVLEPADDM